MKILIPCITAGAIIGKGGETIAQLQAETNTKIKMSKTIYFNNCKKKLDSKKKC